MPITNNFLFNSKRIGFILVGFSGGRLMIEWDILYFLYQLIIGLQGPPKHYRKQGKKNEERRHSVYINPGYFF